jgi:hypothetical protein
MAVLPAQLVAGLSEAQRQAAVEWWERLSDATRAELAVLLDPRADSCSFSLEPDGQGSWPWYWLPVSVDSELLADSAEPDVNWYGDYFEYRLVNPERWRVPPYEERTFYIGGLAKTGADSQTHMPQCHLWTAPNQPLPRRLVPMGGFARHLGSVATAPAEL